MVLPEHSARRGKRKRYHMKKATNTTANNTKVAEKKSLGAKVEKLASKATAKKPPVSNSVKGSPVPLTSADAEAAAKLAVKGMNKSTLTDFCTEFIKSREQMKTIKKETQDQLRYTVRNMARATLSDLREIVTQIFVETRIAEPLVDTSKKTEAPAPSNSEKPKKTLRKKKDAAEEPAPEETEEPKPVEEKPKKSLRKKKTEETPVEEEKPKKKSPSQDLLDLFPETIIVKDGDEETELVLADGDFKDYSDVVKALNDDGQDIYLAVYWSKRHLSQFGYSVLPTIKKPKSFPYDMDVLQMIYAGENVAVSISRYTEAPYYHIPQAFEINEEFGMRFYSGAEFAVYVEK